MDGRRGGHGRVVSLTASSPPHPLPVVRSRLDGGVVVVTIDGPGQPDLAIVEELAELALLARRYGLATRVVPVTSPLCQLLELCGLDGLVLGAGGAEGSG